MARHALGRTPRGRPLAQLAALVLAVVFLLIGVLGFIPGITTDYYDLRFAGHHSEAKLFGVFQVSVLHNLVHLAYGVVGLVLARTMAGVRLFLIGGGAVYLVLWIYGLAVVGRGSANFIPVNNADNYLHLLLAIGMLALGLLLSKRAGTNGRLDNPIGSP